MFSEQYMQRSWVEVNLEQLIVNLKCYIKNMQKSMPFKKKANKCIRYFAYGTLFDEVQLNGIFQKRHLAQVLDMRTAFRKD